jgi:tungstate transport system substrate-binding protein
MSGIDNQKSIIIAAALIVFVVIGGIYSDLTRVPEREQLIVSTTTSLYETGVLDVIKKMFEADYPDIDVLFISQGTGLAITTAERGDSDMILVHSPSQELGFLESGHGVNRKIFAYNFFIIVGPESDPAGIIGMNPLDALNTIVEQGMFGEVLWVSRGDNSGTHSKEKNLWAAAGLELEAVKAETIEGSSESWYIEAGVGMTATLQLANQKEAYTLTDVATYLKNYNNGNIELVKIVDSGEKTLNVYSALVCNPEINPLAKYDSSMLFVRFLISDRVQNLLINYGKDEFGSALFKPWIPELDNPDSEIIEWVEDFAYFDGTECPTMYRYRASDLYQ